MKINKNVMKKTGVGLFGLALAVGAVGGGYVLSQQGVSAEQGTTASSNQQSEEKLLSQVTNANILSALFTKLDEAEKSGAKLSQDELDGYTYYMITYYESGQTYYSDGLIGTPFEGLARLETLYGLSSIEPSFKWVVTDEANNLQKLVLTRDLHKPANFDNFVTDVQSKIEESSDEILSNNGSNVQEIEVDVNESELLEGDQ